MKKYLAGFLMALATLFAAPAWSHHAAEGIVSEEIWDMVDTQLTDVDSPHLDLVFDDMGPTMLVTTYVFDDGGDADAFYLDVSDYLDTELAVVDSRKRGVSFVTISMPVENEDGDFEVAISEPVGRGRSQQDAAEDWDEDWPGNLDPRQESQPGTPPRP